MRNSLTTFFSLLVTAALASVAFGGECSKADAQTLTKLDQDWGTYNQAQDKAALDAILADGYAAFNISGTSDKAEALANLDQPPPPNPPAFVSDHYIISCTGDTAVMTHRNEIKAPAGTFYSRSVHIFQKSGGKWKVVASVNHPMDDGGALIYKNYSGMAAYKARDIDWFDKNMHVGYFYVSPTGSISSRSEALEGIKNDKNKYELMEMTDLDARVEGDMGIVTGVVHMKGTDEQGSPFDLRTRFTRTFTKVDGDWKAVATHSSFVDQP